MAVWSRLRSTACSLCAIVYSCDPALATWSRGQEEGTHRVYILRIFRILRISTVCLAYRFFQGVYILIASHLHIVALCAGHAVFRARPAPNPNPQSKWYNPVTGNNFWRCLLSGALASDCLRSWRCVFAQSKRILWVARLFIHTETDTLADEHTHTHTITRLAWRGAGGEAATY